MDASEERRKERLGVDVKEYKNNVKSSSVHLSKSDLLEKERKELEKLEHRKILEINQLLDSFVKEEEQRRWAEELKARESAKEAAIQADKKVKKRELEHKKLRNQSKMKKTLENEQRIQQEKDKINIEKALIKEIYEDQKALEKQKLLEVKENQRRAKNDEFRRKTEEKMLKDRIEEVERKKYLELKERIQEENLNELNRYKSEKQLRSKAEKEEKFDIARKNLNEILARKSEEFKIRQQKHEEKILKIEKNKEENAHEHCLKAAEKESEFKKVIQMNKLILEKRKKEFEHIQNTTQEQIRIKRNKREEIIKKKVEDEVSRQPDPDKARVQETEILRVSKIKKTQEKRDKQVKEFKEKKEKEQKINVENEKLKLKDRQENIHRIAKVNEEQRQKKIQKIQEENERVESLKRAKEDLKSQLKLRREQTELEKKKILDKFHEVRENNGDITLFIREIESQLALNPNPKKPKRNVNRTPKKIISIDKPKDPPHPHPSHADLISKKISVQEIREKHLKELRELLDLERVREEERKDALRNAGEEERQDLEDKFQLERCNASEHIKHISKLQQQTEQELIDKLGIPY